MIVVERLGEGLLLVFTLNDFLHLFRLRAINQLNICHGRLVSGAETTLQNTDVASGTLCVART
jgi:hypothetical protein